MLRARQEGITPEALIERIAGEHQADFAGFHIGFDNYYSTHSNENRELAEGIYLKLRDAGHITRRTISQFYDPQEQMFLPDRFIKGTCPRCGTPDQYGDNCEVCGATYDAGRAEKPASRCCPAPRRCRRTPSITSSSSAISRHSCISGQRKNSLCYSRFI